MYQETGVRRRRKAHGKSKALSLWMDAQMKEFAQAEADREGVTLALWMEELVRREKGKLGGRKSA